MPKVGHIRSSMCVWIANRGRCGSKKGKRRKKISGSPKEVKRALEKTPSGYKGEGSAQWDRVLK